MRCVITYIVQYMYMYVNISFCSLQCASVDSVKYGSKPDMYMYNGGVVQHITLNKPRRTLFTYLNNYI